MSCLATQCPRKPHIHLGDMRLRRLEVDDDDDVPMASMDSTAARTASKSGSVSVHLTTNDDGNTRSSCDLSRALDGLFDAVAGRSVGVSTPRNRLVLHANCSLHDGGRSVSSAVHRRNDDRRMCNGIIVFGCCVSYGVFACLLVHGLWLVVARRTTVGLCQKVRKVDGSVVARQ